MSHRIRFCLDITWPVEGSLPVELVVYGWHEPYIHATREDTECGGYVEDLEVKNARGTALPADVNARLNDDEVFCAAVYERLAGAAQDTY